MAGRAYEIPDDFLEAADRFVALANQLGENASRRMLQALMDSAEVLTPEQRAKLAERLQRRMPPGG